MARNIDRPAVDAPSAHWAAYLEGLAPSELDEYEAEPLKTDYPTGLDGHDVGDPKIGDINGLSRTNYFNGRYLDAEALRRDQVYFARRDRLVAQTEHAGIAWGLGLDYPRRDLQTDRPGLTVASQIVLHPGVAFDGDGRPILVDRNFPFTLDELLTEYAQNPSRAVKPSSRFQPCVCVERMPGNEDAGPEYPTGAYILVISPTAHSEGSARVYADPCAKDRNVHCDANAWRHAFRLSLVRYDTFQHEQFNIQDSCELRGELAAHYFDRWERNLRARWRPDFARDHRFCEGLGPFHRAPGAVALGMVFVTSGGDVSVFDPWIPRRYQISSASRAWEAAVRGAPTPTASVARRHQFQCQLAECLDREFELRSRDLHNLGFRHLAPCGFLPIDIPKGLLQQREAAWREAGLGYHEAERIRAVRDLADRYFQGTNLMPRYRVAVYEDDIFEEMDNAAEKDPMVVRRANTWFWQCLSEWFFSLGYGGATRLEILGRDTETGYEGIGFSEMFSCLLESDAHTLELVINRELELLDVIIPLYGRRYHDEPVPVPDEVEEAKELGLDVEGLSDVLGDSIAARQFVFFVKRRVVLDDWIYLLLDALLDLLALFRLFSGFQPPNNGGDESAAEAEEEEEGVQVVEVHGQTTEMTKAKASFLPAWNRNGSTIYTAYELAEMRPKMALSLDIPEIRTFASALLRRARPELRSAAVLETYDTIAAERAKKYAGSTTSKAAAERRGRLEAIDVMLNEYPGFGDYKALAIIDPNLLANVHEDLKAESDDSAPVSAQVFKPDSIAELNPTKSAIYSAARASFGETRVTVDGKSLARNEVLYQPTADLEEKGAKSIAEETAKAGRKLDRAARRVAESSLAGPKLARAYEEAVVEYGEEKALGQLEKKKGYKTVAGDLQAIKEVVGPKGLDRIMLTMRKQ